MKKAPFIAAVITLAAGTFVNAQWQVLDVAQVFNSTIQIAKQVEELARLDQEILSLRAQFDQMKFNATHFAAGIKNSWRGTGNPIVRNWTVPNYYGETAGWQTATNLASGNLQAWQQATLAMPRNLYLSGGTVGSSRDYSYTASVNTLDAAGPAAIQTLGNARVQQTQMDQAIRQLQAAAWDGSDETNTEVEQLNLLTTGTVQNLEMQQTANNTLTSLLEQQMIANKIQRDQIADHMNFTAQVNQYRVNQPVAWGNAVQSITSWRLQ